MSIKKKHKALATLLSAVCSVTSANAGESKKIGAQGSGNTKNISQGNNTTNSKIKSSGLKGGLGDLLSNHAGLLFVGTAMTGGLLYNAKSGLNYYKERSKNEELKKSTSDIENLQKEVEKSDERCGEMSKKELLITKEQMAMEGLLISTDQQRLNPVKLYKDSASLTKLHDLNCQNLEKLKKEKDIEDEKFKKSLNELTNSLTSIMIKLGTQDNAFKEKLNSSLSNLKPQDGHGVIDLFKAILKSFEEAWCAASLENTKSDNDDAYNNLNNQQARLEFFINKYLDLLLPMDADADGLPKNKNTRTVAGISHLFYKYDAPNQLTIEKFITNSFGNSVIVSSLAKRFQNIRTTFSKVDESSITKFLELYSPLALKKLNRTLDEKIGKKGTNMFIFYDLRDLAGNLIGKLSTFLLAGKDSIAISDASIKNLFGSLVNDGCDNELLPKNCFRILNNYENCTLENIMKTKTQAGLTLNSLNNLEGLYKLFTGENGLISKPPNNINSADPSDRILELTKDLFSGEKNENVNKDEPILGGFMKKSIADAPQRLATSWKINQLDKEFVAYEEHKAKHPDDGNLTDDDNNLHLLLNDLDPKKWTDEDLDNLKIVHTWNYLLSCAEDYEPGFFGKTRKGSYKYDENSEEWQNAKKALENIKPKLGTLKLTLVPPETANIWYLEYESAYFKKTGGA